MQPPQKNNTNIGPILRIFGHVKGTAINIAWIIRPAVIVLLYLLLKESIFAKSTNKLISNQYYEPILLFQALRTPQFLLSFTWAAILALYTVRTVTWRSFGTEIRLATIFILFITLTWDFSTYTYNVYYGRHHLFDRLFLVILACLTTWRPLFMPACLMQFFLLVYQFDVPPLFYSFTDKILPINVLTIFCSFLISRLFMKQTLADFLFVTLCLIAAHYFTSGISKVKVGWVSENQLNNLFVSSYVNGWLHSFETDQIITIASFIALVNMPLKLATIILELSGILFLVSRKLCLVILFCLSLFHVGVFILTGTFFWKWIIVDLAIAHFIYKSNDSSIRSLFQDRGRVLIFSFCVYFSPFTPPHLAWYDSPLSHTFDFEAVGSSGNRYTLGRHFFSPYDIPFCQNRFQFLTTERLLTRTSGAINPPPKPDNDRLITYNRQLNKVLNSITSAGQAEAFAKANGLIYFHPVLVARFEGFLRRFVNNRNQNDTAGIYNVVAPPHHLWTSVDSNFERGTVIFRIDIRLNRFFYNRQSIQKFSSKIIRSVYIPMSGEALNDSGGR